MQTGVLDVGRSKKSLKNADLGHEGCMPPSRLNMTTYGPPKIFFDLIIFKLVI